MLTGSQAHVMGFMPLLRIMNPGVCTMSLCTDVNFCAKVEGQGVILTSDTHVASFTQYIKLIANTKLKFTGNKSFKKKKKLKK